VNRTSVDSTTVVNDKLIIASITVQPTALLGEYTVTVTNADATSTLTTATSKTLTVTDQNTPGAALRISAIALTGPRNGALVAAGGELFGEAMLAGSGSGIVTGVWVWDGNITEQFNVALAGGSPVALRSQHSFPTTFVGVHTLELRVLQPNAIISRPVTLIISPQEFKTEQILGPEYGAFAAVSGPPLLRWAPVPGAAKYQVGFSSQPYLATVTSWVDVNGNEWRVPAAVWNTLEEGE